MRATTGSRRPRHPTGVAWRAGHRGAHSRAGPHGRRRAGPLTAPAASGTGWVCRRDAEGSRLASTRVRIRSRRADSWPQGRRWTTTVSESSQPAGPYVPTRPRTLGVYREKGDGRHGCTPDLDPMRTLRCDPWREGREAARPRGDPTALAEARPSRGPVRPSRAWTGPLGGDWPPREKPWWTWHWGSGPRPSAQQAGTPTRAELPPTTLSAAALLPSLVDDLMLHRATDNGRPRLRQDESGGSPEACVDHWGMRRALGARSTGHRRSRQLGSRFPGWRPVTEQRAPAG
ncbi:hypothetical protein NODU109028_02955 [Nocardioides dubius]